MTFYSVDQSVTWASYQGRGVHDLVSVPVWETGPRTKLFRDDHVTWSWRWNGCGVGTIHYDESNDRVVFWRFPYWSLVIPITLFSARLILVPPRKQPPTGSQPDE